MPIYEYECSKCGHFEVMQKASDKPLKADPDCKHKSCPKSAQRLISASAFHLKGSGWYKTDYTSGSSATGSSGKSSSSKSDAKSESKSSEKKEAKKTDGGSDSGSGSCGSGCGCH